MAGVREFIELRGLGGQEAIGFGHYAPLIPTSLRPSTNCLYWPKAVIKGVVLPLFVEFILEH